MSTPTPAAERATCLLRLQWDGLIIGFADGSVARSNLHDLLCNGVNGRLRARSEKERGGMQGEIVFLQVLGTAGLQRELLVAGSDDGGVGIYDLSDLRLLARRVVFAAPLVQAALVEDGYAGLRDGIVCFSEDGSVVLVDGADGVYTFCCTIPSSSTPLLSAHLSTDNLIFLYTSGKARLWDVKTRELWRIMDREKALEMCAGVGWQAVEVDQIGEVSPVPMLDLPSSALSLDSGIAQLLSSQSTPSKQKSNGTSHLHHPSTDLNTGIERHRPGLPEQMHSVLPIVAASFTYGVDERVDGLCDEHGAGGGGRSVFLPSVSSAASSTSANSEEDQYALWQVSPTATTFLLLALLAVLRVSLTYDVYEMHASAIIAFYVSSLPETVPAYKPPSLDVIVRLWFDPSAEIQHAARLLFNAVLSRMGDGEVIAVAELWQRQLPCLQPDAEQNSPACARALAIAGNIAAERYNLLSTNTLRDISKSISLYLHDDTCRYTILAIELCSRGFAVWQNYTDAVETLRTLFRRAVSLDKPHTRTGVGHHSRLAILQIASASTALFMTTVSLDIINAPTPEHLKSIMLVVAFIVRKKPLVLYPSLPRLVDAVVKSLDPNSSSRDAVLQPATVLLDQLVHTYPSVAFNAKVQRLAVGTIEGAVIMYDLKTATRLYVLEAHRKRVSACSFSPDGRRLVTASLEESVVMVWKVGTSFSSLFNPGGPPRQGHNGSDPYKTIPFSAGEEGHMTVAAMLEWVKFEWPAERTARLKIRESTFTFST